MKKDLFLTSALLVATLLAGFAHGDNGASKNAIDDLSNDFIQADVQKFGLKSLNSVGDIEYSKTYAQYAVDSEGYHYLRFATAIKGSNISSITFTRGEVVGKDATVYPEATIEVTSLYKYLLANDERTYFNGTELVTEESELTSDYYWACFSIKFNSDNCYESNINVSLKINEEEVEADRMATLYEIRENSHTFSETPTRFDEDYHYYACTDEGFNFEKKEAHDLTSQEMREPTLTSTGLTEGSTCSLCDHTTQKVLPILSEEHYDVVTTRSYENGVVVDTATFTLKDTSIGEYTFTAVVNEFSDYIKIANNYYSIDEFNSAYPNLVASVDNEYLTITINEGTTTTIDNLTGVIELYNYKTTTITGNGVLNINMTAVGSTYSDCINAYSLVIEEGATLNINGANNANKTAVKVRKDFIINGTVNISNYGHGQYIDYTSSESTTLVKTEIGVTGVLNMDNIKYGIVAYKDAWRHKPSFINNGKFNITNCTGDGLSFAGADANIYLRGNSETYISVKGIVFARFNGLYVGDGDKGATQNNAKLTAISSTDNVIISKENSGGYTEFVFNSLNTILIESTTGKNDKSGIQIGYKNLLKLFTISCADMTIRGCNRAIGCWNAQSCIATYNYEAPNAKLKVENCKSIAYHSTSGSKLFACFTEDNVIYTPVAA